MTDIPQLSVRDLKSQFDDGGTLVLLDVREPKERAYCAIAPPSGVLDMHIPMGELVGRLTELSSLETRPIVVYCHHGARSLATARWLAHQGVGGIVNLDGGIDAWSTEVDRQTPRY